MKMPTLIPPSSHVKSLVRFGGYEPFDGGRENSFSRMCNLTSDSFPLLSVRKGRQRLSISGAESAVNGTGYFNDGRLTLENGVLNDFAVVDGRAVFCTDTAVYVNGEASGAELTDISPQRHKLAVFGKSFLVYPDGIFFQPNEQGYGIRHTRFNKRFTNVLAKLTDSSGTEFAFDSYGESLPQNPHEAQSFVLILPEGIAGYTYSQNGWSAPVELFVSLSADSIGVDRCSGELLYVSGLTHGRAKCRVMLARSNSISVSLGEAPTDAFLSSEGQIVYSSVTLSAKMPLMDFVCSHNNRLWGCRYGENDSGELVNEVYASALGDGVQWDCFNGISTDSYSVSLGCGGNFTGMCSMGGELLVFKEDSLTVIGGRTPEEFSLRSFPARGIKRGAETSLAVVEEKAFYLSDSGVTVFDGTLPYVISEALGETDFSVSCACGYKGKYYLGVSCDGESCFLVFDCARGVWHRESSSEPAKHLFKAEGELFAVCLTESASAESTYSFWNMCPTGSPPFDIFRLTPYPEAEYIYIEEPSVEWYGILERLNPARGGTSVVRGVYFRLSLGENACLKAAIRCNGESSFKDICTVKSPRKGLFTFRVSTPRCDDFALKLYGVNACSVKEMGLITENTSEVTRHG